MAFLDKNGLQILWGHIIARLNTKADKSQVEELSELVGDTPVSEQIAAVGQNVIVSESEPAAQEGAIWLKPAVVTTGAIDFIVEEGTSGIWTYRKWNSGIAECWGTYQSSVTMSQAWGSMYINPTPTSRQAYPFTFTQRPRETVAGRTESYACFIYAESSANGLNTTTQTAQYNFIRATSSTSATSAYIDYYVVGQWK